MGYFIKNRKTGLDPYGTSIPRGDTSNRPANPIVGSLRYNETNNKLEFWNGSEFASIVTNGNVLIEIDSFIGNGIQTTFTLSQSVFNNDQVLVFVGGVYQVPGDAYGISGGTDLIFYSVPPNNTKISVIHNMGKIA